MQIRDDNLVAYRLGILKDGPTFEVRLGKWIELTDQQKRDRTAVDSGSLDPDQLFSAESFERCPRGGTELGGVAFFVAELKFADSRIWRQDLTRDGLLWDSMGRH